MLLQLYWDLRAAPAELAFDVRHHVRTWRGIRWLARARQRRQASPHARAYEGTGVADVATLLSYLPDDVGTFTFIDLGCGAGKALLIAWGRGFGRLIGVELSPKLASLARQNVIRYRGPKGSGTVEITEGDARSITFPEGPIVLFLYDPFDGTVMGEVVERLTESLRRSPRRAYVLYHVPLERSYWDASPLTLIHESTWNVVYVFDDSTEASRAPRR